ncbi:MAG: hypothetical protein AVDCRST_MAG36-1426 [uncultured Nocardioidaceae bacterium]|uniref:Uncharacterized protein n=1 Tax=uncultured Nocardioidaceae bacterium TaxID=253824 RepID=A0A6J4LTW9_9ACTN|nr:MAG: hypothetical protein AVDCRST_MAG36-1426 [uncultured Nocardioidaceae bacterium]
MSAVELEPDRNRLHDLVRLVWETAQHPGATEEPVPAPDPARGPVAVTDEDVAAAGPYSVEQVREHLLAEQDGTYTLERDGDAVRVLGVLPGPAA